MNILGYALTLNTSNFINGLGTSTLALGGLAAALMATKAVLATYAEYDGLVRGLKTLDGTAEATRKRLAELAQVAKLPGLGFEEAVKGDVRLRSAGISAELSAKSMRSFGNAIATVGGGKEQLAGVMLALTQIASKGKVTAEEINQINERVPQVRQAMLKAFGTADTEALQKMGITATTFITAMADELGKLAPITTGARNALENYDDAWKQLKNSSAEFFTGVSEGVVGELTTGFRQANRLVVDLKNAMGIKTAGLEGKDTQTEEDRLAVDRVKAQFEAIRWRVAQEKELLLANNDYQVRLATEYQAMKAQQAKEDAQRQAANLSEVKAAQEVVFAARLSAEQNLQRQIADLQGQGRWGAEAINAITAGSDLQAKVAQRTAEIVRLQKELNDLREAGAAKAQQEADAVQRQADAAAAKSKALDLAAEAQHFSARIFQMENNLLGARAGGDKKAVEEAERRLNVERLKASLMNDQGLSEKEALAAARNRVALEEAAKKAGEQPGRDGPKFRNAEQTARARAEALARRQAADPKGFGNADKILLENLQRKFGPIKLDDAALALGRGAAAADPARARRAAADAGQRPDPLTKLVQGIHDRFAKLAIA